MRLIDEWRFSAERADTLLAEWDLEAARRSLGPTAAGYWREAEDWLRQRRSER